MKVHLSLESNINLINASGLIGFKVNKEEIEILIKQIVNNFFSPLGKSLATQTYKLWQKTKDRDMVKEFFSIAYEVEMHWRQTHQYQTTMSILCSTDAFVSIPFTSLQALTVPQELELKSRLSSLLHADFLKTRYWLSVRLETMRMYGFECQGEIEHPRTEVLIPCGKQVELDVFHKTLDHLKGMEHRHYSTDLILLCDRCSKKLPLELLEGVQISIRL
jgi:hypothetical protein